jgi:hypothetical protein
MVCMLFTFLSLQHTCAMVDVSYTTAAGLWRRSGFITITSTLGTRIAVFPIDFLTTCGDNTWNYVAFAVSCVIDIDPSHPGAIVDDQYLPVALELSPTPGTFQYVEAGTSISLHEQIFGNR